MKNSSDPVVSSGIFGAASAWLSRTMHGVKNNPVLWTAILLAAGSACLLAKSAHIGTVLISAVGILWMWQDMLDDDARAAEQVAAVPVA